MKHNTIDTSAEKPAIKEEPDDSIPVIVKTEPIKSEVVKVCVQTVQMVFHDQYT